MKENIIKLFHVVARFNYGHGFLFWLGWLVVVGSSSWALEAQTPEDKREYSDPS